MKKLLYCVVLLAFLFAACAPSDESPNPQKDLQKKIKQRGQNRQPYEPSNEVEFNNFNKAQELYDSPETIVWCTFAWSNPSAPIVTVPIAGKLTSSSVSYLPQDRVDWSSEGGGAVRQAASSDGMYHGSPTPYRYGFTPGGQYNEFLNLETFCTTALTKFQREKTFVSTSLDSSARSLDDQAQQALKKGDKKGAQAILDQLEGENK